MGHRMSPSPRPVRFDIDTDEPIQFEGNTSEANDSTGATQSQSTVMDHLLYWLYHDDLVLYHSDAAPIPGA